MKYLLFAAVLCIASPALAQTASAQEAPVQGHAGHAGHNAPAPAMPAPAQDHAEHSGQTASPMPGAGGEARHDMAECCCCCKHDHAAMMQHETPQAGDDPSSHEHR